MKIQVENNLIKTTTNMAVPKQILTAVTSHTSQPMGVEHLWRCCCEKIRRWSLETNIDDILVDNIHGKKLGLCCVVNVNIVFKH